MLTKAKGIRLPGTVYGQPGKLGIAGKQTSAVSRVTGVIYYQVDGAERAISGKIKETFKVFAIIFLNKSQFQMFAQQSIQLSQYPCKQIVITGILDYDLLQMAAAIPFQRHVFKTFGFGGSESPFQLLHFRY